MASTTCTSQRGRNIVITGGTRGLGRLQAQQALLCGANHVTITGRPADSGGTPEDGVQTEHELGQQYGADRITYVQSDVRSDDDSHRLFDPASRAKACLPPQVHAVSLNAGIFGPADESRRLTALSTSDFEAVMATNCTGAFRGLRDFARAARATGVEEPSAVLIKSIYGSGGSVFSNAGYQASKFCVNGLVKQGSVELARSGITVNSVSPGFVKTPLTAGWWQDEQVDAIIADAHPQGTWVDGDSIAQTAEFLLRAPRSMTGVDLFVDGGVTAESVPQVSQAETVRSITGEPCCGKTA